MENRQRDAAGPPAWTWAMQSEAGFRQEQEQLASLWTFLCFARDIPDTHDWVRASLGGRSVFVQRFEAGLRGFENLCRHRFHPIRTRERGNGPMICGFHQWRYNKDGLALGVPKCEKQFGQTPRALGACLQPLQVECCGGLVFGRFGEGPSLQEWLGVSFGILAHLTRKLDSGHTLNAVVQAHWRFMLEITLEEYHIVAVHPSTFGKRGHHEMDRIGYYRFSPHSAYFFRGEPDDLQRMASACEQGTYVPHRYRIFQIFPTLIVSVSRVTRFLGDDYWYLVVQHLTPEAHNRTSTRSRFFPLAFTTAAGPLRHLLRRVAQPIISLGVRHYLRKIHQEDYAVCEQLQGSVHQVRGRRPILGGQEQRIGWLAAAYEQMMAGQFHPDRQSQEKQGTSE